MSSNRPCQAAKTAPKGSRAKTQIVQPQTLMRRRRKNDSEKDTFDEVADMARTGYHLAVKLADLMNIETKCYYYGQTGAQPTPSMQTLTPTWSSLTPVTTLNFIENGDNDYQRIGDSLKIQHLDLVFSMSNTNRIEVPEFRVVVFWDETQQTPTADAVLETAFFGTPLITAIPKDWDEKSATKILHDKVYRYNEVQYDSNTNSFITNSSATHRISMPINLHTQFEQDALTIATGALKFFVVTSVANSLSQVRWTARLLFTDD